MSEIIFPGAGGDVAHDVARSRGHNDDPATVPIPLVPLTSLGSAIPSRERERTSSCESNGWPETKPHLTPRVITGFEKPLDYRERSLAVLGLRDSELYELAIYGVGEVIGDFGGFGGEVDLFWVKMKRCPGFFLFQN